MRIVEATFLASRVGGNVQRDRCELQLVVNLDAVDRRLRIVSSALEMSDSIDDCNSFIVGIFAINSDLMGTICRDKGVVLYV